MVVVLCLAGLPVAFSQTTVPNRVVQAADSGQMTILQGNIHPLARLQFDQGRVSPDMQVHGVSLVFKLSASQQAALEQLLAEQRDPASPNYHQWLTPEQYAARFGMSQDDLDKVTSWLQSQGFTGILVSRNHNEISFDGSVAQIESAFRTQMHHYLVNGEMHFANSTAPAIPAAFADVALALRRLNDFRPHPRARRPVADFTSAVSGNHFISPRDFATIYDLPANFDGTGVTIVVAGQTQLGTTPTDVSDATAFRSASGLPANPPHLVLMPGSGNSTLLTSDVDEANLDVEWSGGVAKGATILYEYVGNAANFHVFDAWQDAVLNNRGSIVSVSYGACEADFGSPTGIAATRQVAQQANAQGQTLTGPSGDDGAADCDGGAPTPVSVATRGLSVDVPAAIPEVTGVGGTEFNGDASSTSTTTYWLGATGSDTISSARQYIPEMAWNDSPVTGTGTVLSSDLSATGGGASTLFSKPSWQTGPGVPADNARHVPDVSLAGSANHDGFLVCSQGFCTSGFRNSAGALDVFGGTSVGAQTFAGILAILNQATHSNGLGNVNPTLYALAANSNTANAFHDVTSGNNIVPCTAGTPNCPSSGALQFGYSAGVGYDQATGLGSVDVNKLVVAWTGTIQMPSFTAGGSDTVASAGNSGVSTITITPVGGFTGLVAVTCPMASLPPGVTCSPLNITVTSSAAATGQLTVNVAAPSPAGTTAEVLPSARTVYASLQRGPTGRGGWWKLSAGTGLAALFLMFVPGRRRRAAMGVWLVCLLSFAMGCGGGSGGGGPVAVATATKITAMTTKAAQGTSLSFNIAVTASGAPMGNGMVQLFDDVTALGAPMQVVNGAVTISNNTLTVGTYAISAHYLGDPNTQASQSGAVNVTLTGTTPLTISTNPASSNGNAVFNLTIN